MQKQFEIPADGQLHIHSSGPLTYILKPSHDGQSRAAEVCGAELAPGEPYYIEEADFGIFSPTGCTIIVEGDQKLFDTMYVDTLGAGFHRSVLDIHYMQSAQRRLAKQAKDGRVGPCTLVCGTSSDIGKSSVSLTLANYCVRLGYQPIYLDLDAATPCIGAPGCVSVFNLQYPLSAEGRHQVPGQHIYVGDAKNMSMHQNATTIALDLIERRWIHGARIMLGGLIADYPTLDAAEIEAAERLSRAQQSSVSKAEIKSPLEALRFAIEQLSIDTLVIVGSSWLRDKLLATYNEGDNSDTLTLASGQEVTLVVMDQAQGAVRRGDAQREALARTYWKTYFCGNRSAPISSTVLEVSAEKVWVLRIMVSGDDDSLQSVLSIDHTQTELGVVREALADLKPGSLLGLADTYFATCSMEDSYSAEASFTELDPEDVYRKIRTSRKLLGFARIETVGKSSLSLRMPHTLLPQPVGCCFIIHDGHHGFSPEFE